MCQQRKSIQEWPTARRVLTFCNQRGTAEQHIKEGKNAIVWIRLSCMRFRNNEVRLQLHALAYNLATFMRTLALPEAVKHWSLTSLRQKLVKIGARIIGHGRYVTFQMAEVAVLTAIPTNSRRVSYRTALNIALVGHGSYCLLTNRGASGECRMN